MSSKEYRIKWLGFDDLRFMLVGIPLLAVVAKALNHEGSSTNSLTISFLFYLIALSFCTFNWLGYRKIGMESRRIFANSGSELRRIFGMSVASFVYFFVLNISWTLFVGFVADQFGYGAEVKKFSSSGSIAEPFVLSVMMIAIYEVIYFNTRLNQSEKLIEETKAANTISQLNVLQNQSKPHFLFNSLNTLRYMISEEPSDKAEHFVDQLASVYRFIIGAGDENLIPLSEELDFISSYLFIQKERFGKNLQVKLEVPEKYHSMAVAPMSVQQLIENAIKHNVVSSKKPLVIELYIENDELADYLVVYNQKDIKITPERSTQTGLKNIIRRYELLSDKTVIVNDSPNKFEVKIPLLISSEIKASLL